MPAFPAAPDRYLKGYYSSSIGGGADIAFESEMHASANIQRLKERIKVSFSTTPFLSVR